MCIRDRIALLTNFEIPESSHQKNILICIAFGLLVMNIIIFCLINDILKREVPVSYTHLTDIESDDLKLVARALLPPEIMEGSRLKYELMQYEIIA